MKLNHFVSILLFTGAMLILAACEAEQIGPIHSIGNADAPVLIEEFSDLQCPACAQISPQVEKIVRRNASIARMEYRHFPLSYHQYAFRAAEASECASDQDKFWEFIGLAFKNQNNLTDSGLFSIAEQLNLNTDAFEECLNSKDKRGKVSADLAEGRRRGVPATPTLYVNGKMVRFSSADTFESYIKSLAQ